VTALHRLNFKVAVPLAVDALVLRGPAAVAGWLNGRG